MKKLLLVTAWVAVTLVALACACGGSTPSVRTPAAGSSGDDEATAQAAPLGASRSNPAPAGSEVEIGDITLTVDDVVRPADDVVAEAGMFNPRPEGGNEYLIVTLSITCNRESDATCHLAPIAEFGLVGSSGIVRKYEFVSGVDGVIEPGEMFGGATLTGKIVFQVEVDETDLFLKYEELFGLGEAYLALP